MGLPAPGRDSPQCSLTGNCLVASKSAPRLHHTPFCFQSPFRVGSPYNSCTYLQGMREPWGLYWALPAMSLVPHDLLTTARSFLGLLCLRGRSIFTAEASSLEISLFGGQHAAARLPHLPSRFCICLRSWLILRYS